MRVTSVETSAARPRVRILQRWLRHGIAAAEARIKAGGIASSGLPGPLQYEWRVFLGRMDRPTSPNEESDGEPR